MKLSQPMIAVLCVFAILGTACTQPPADENAASDLPATTQKPAADTLAGDTADAQSAPPAADYIQLSPHRVLILEDYACTGGSPQGFRMDDAVCRPVGGNAYTIRVDAGVVGSSIDPEKGLISNQLVTRPHYLDARCAAYPTDLGIGSEHYLCDHTKNGYLTYTMGVGKSIHQTGIWFEAHLTVETPEDGMEYGGILADFVSRAIEVDWSIYQ